MQTKLLYDTITKCLGVNGPNITHLAIDVGEDRLDHHVCVRWIYWTMLSEDGHSSPTIAEASSVDPKTVRRGIQGLSDRSRYDEPLQRLICAIRNTYAKAKQEGGQDSPKPKRGRRSKREAVV